MLKKNEIYGTFVLSCHIQDGFASIDRASRVFPLLFNQLTLYLNAYLKEQKAYGSGIIVFLVSATAQSQGSPYNLWRGASV